MFARHDNPWWHLPALILANGLVFAGLAWAQKVSEPSIPSQLPPSRGKEIIEVAMNGELLPTLGLSSISLPPVSNRFTLYLKPDHPRRRQFRLEGVDAQWREYACGMAIGLRFFHENGEQLGQEVENIIGESPGWNGSLERPVFITRKVTLTAPPGAHRVWFMLSSAGPPDTLGTLLVKQVKITRTRGTGPPEVILRAPMGRDPHPHPVKPAPMGFTADGLRPRMASLITLATTSSGGQPEECLAIVDDDVLAHAEWRMYRQTDLIVAEGDRLDVEWQEAYSVGGGTILVQPYDRPPPGTYQLRVRPLDLQGRPEGEETTLAIHVLAPWWQQQWVWVLTGAGVIAMVFALSRYIAHQRLREELTRMKEVALRKAELELTRMARATTIGEFTASIVHEISQPLAGITTNASACLRWLSPERSNSEEARAAAQRIIGDCDRVVQIVVRIRALLAKEKLIRESSSINEVIEELLPLLKTDIRRRGVELECHLGSNLPAVAIDRVQIQQVIMNLVINGLDAMKGVTDRSRILRIYSGHDAEHVWVKVEDSGTGLDPATVGRLFERFFTTKTEGLGMGLAICQSIVVSHGGRLVAISNPDHGAAFQFTLPIETRVIHG